MTCWLALVVTSATPADDLLKLVPPDAAVVAVVRDLRGTADRLRESPFARSVLGLVPPGELAQARQSLDGLADRLGSTPRQLLDDVFGDAVVLAYNPGPPDRPADESGLVLLHARDPLRLARTVERLNATQQQAGELTAVRDRSHAGVGYLERVKAAGGSEFAFRAGGLLAFSAQEPPVRGLIDRRGAAAEPFPGLRRLIPADAVAGVWFNPPQLAGDLHARRDAATDPAEKAALAQLARVWAASDGFALSARIIDRLELSAAVALDPARLPEPLRPVIYPADRRTLWGAVPDTAMLAVGGRLDLPALLAAAASFSPDGGLTQAVTEAVGPVVGKSKLSAVLAGVGPEWVAWAEPPAAGWVPDWTVAVRLTADARRPVSQALDLGIGLVRLGYNRDHADQLDLADDVRDGRVVRYLSGLAQKPAYGLVGDFLVFASSPDRVHAFRPGDSPPDPPVVRADAARIVTFLADKREAVANGLAAQDGRPADEVRRELDELSGVLRLIRSVELRHTSADGVVRLTLSVRPRESLSAAP